MKEIFKSKTFWLVFVIAAAVIFVALINLNQTYESRTDILVILRSQTAVQNSDQILNNLAALPSSLSFYDKMIQDNPDVIAAGTESMPDAEKKAYWDSKIKIERLPGSGILEITAIDPSMSRAEIFSESAANELVATAGFYYNIQADIDIRIIDGPITRQTCIYPEYILFFEGLVGGFLLVTFAFFISFLLFGEKEENISQRPIRWTFTGEKTFSPLSRTLENIGWESAAIDLQKKRNDVKLKPVPEADKSEEKATPKEELQAEFPEAQLSTSKKAAAPANLPIAEDLPGFSVPQSKDNKPAIVPEKKEEALPAEEKKEAELEKKEPIIREATPDEVKERLNKLLSGKL